MQVLQFYELRARLHEQSRPRKRKIASCMKKILSAEDRERRRIKRVSARQSAHELRVKPGSQTHEHLFKIVKHMDSDFEPYGKRSRELGGGDCSCSCKWYHELDGSRGLDWGVCANPGGPRCGLLTFEHQGCIKYECDPRAEYLNTAAGKRALARFYKNEEEIRNWLRRHTIRIIKVRPKRFTGTR